MCFEPSHTRLEALRPGAGRIIKQSNFPRSPRGEHSFQVLVQAILDVDARIGRKGPSKPERGTGDLVNGRNLCRSNVCMTPGPSPDPLSGKPIPPLGRVFYAFL